MDETVDPKKAEHVFWLTFALAVLSWISIKMVLPALPGLPKELYTTSDGIKLTVTVYLFFFAISQPFWGAVVQKVGARRALYATLGITIVGSVTAMLSTDLSSYITGRALEGIGMGGVSPITRTLIVDYFDRKALSVRIGIISGTAATMPAAAPIVAGHIMLWFDWRAIFAVFLLLTLLLVYALYRYLPRSDHSETVTFSGLLNDYRSILSQSPFWGYSLPFAASMGGLLGYYSAMPYWYHVQLGIPAHNFAYLAVPTVGMFVVGLVVSGWLVRSRTIDTIILYGAVMTLIATLLALCAAAFALPTIGSIVTATSLFGFGTGLIVPNTNAGVLARFRQTAAPTAALVSVSAFGSGSLLSVVSMDLYIATTLWPVAFYLGALSLICLLSSYFWVWLPSRAKR
jgi:DHA1 family bicyclomycin/chloramphenicol resistance-like MFS transporter